MNYMSFVVVVAAGLFCLAAVSAQEESHSHCGVNEAVYECGRRCEDRCNVPIPPWCAAPHCHDKGCRCKPGFLREQHSKKCVRLRDCPLTGCAIGEFLGDCGRKCEGTCESPKEPEHCSKIQCYERKCRCDLEGGYVRNKNGKCMHVTQCPHHG